MAIILDINSSGQIFCEATTSNGSRQKLHVALADLPAEIQTELLLQRDRKRQAENDRHRQVVISALNSHRDPEFVHRTIDPELKVNVLKNIVHNTRRELSKNDARKILTRMGYSSSEIDNLAINGKLISEASGSAIFSQASKNIRQQIKAQTTKPSMAIDLD